MNSLYEGAKNFGVELSEKQLEQFCKYMEMLLDYNTRINLTAIVDKDEIIQKHFVDSVSLISSGKIKENAKVIDIGAGGGFPSIPLKIAREDIDLCMLDSLNKRVGFLNDVVSALKLPLAEAVHMRAEDGGKEKKMREAFDIATARAVAELAVLSEYALPFVKVGGYFLAMKGPKVQEEIETARNAIKICGGEIEEVKSVYIPAYEMSHNIVIIKKVKQTPSEFPRKAGKASKDPLR